MRLRHGLLAAALLVAALIPPAIGAGLFSTFPAATSANITDNNCIPVDVYGPSVTNSQGVNPATVCAKPSDLTNFAFPPKPLIGYTTIPVGTVAYGTGTTNTTPVAGTQYWAMLDVPVSYSVTGIACLNGDTAATDLLIYGLWDSTGALVANTSLSGTLAANANTFQSIAFTSPYTITPGRYFVGWQTNGTTTRFETIAASTFVNVLTASDTGSFGTLEALTVPTTFTADKGPVCGIYD